MKKQRLPAVLAFLCVVVMLVVGRYTYKDYGMTLDEFTDRGIAMLNYQYVANTYLGQDAHVIEGTLQESRDRYYGVALQMPMVFVEALSGFTMPLHEGFAIRHFYIFSVCLCGWICFYWVCQKIFQNRWLALLGMLMVALYPRFWGEQFTNIKDLVFAAVCCAALLGVCLCLEHEGKWRYEVLGAFLSALCANTRFVGFQFPALLFGYRLLRDWVLLGVPEGERKAWLMYRFPRYVFHLALLLLFYIVLTPAAWSAPFSFLREMFGTFSNYDTWQGTVLFLGKSYPGNGLPWYYLSVWVLFSVPLWYLALAAYGAIRPALTPKGQKTSLGEWVSRLLLGHGRYLVLCLVVAFIPLLAPLLKEVTLYNSWRHAYYVLPMLVIAALYGVEKLWNFTKGRRAAHAAVAICLCALLGYQAVWTALNHPYEKVYFNPVGRQYAEQMDRDHWNETDTRQLRTILQNDPSERVTVTGKEDIYRVVHYFLTPEESKRIICVYEDSPSAEYWIDIAQSAEEPEKNENYTPVFQIRMRDGLLLSTLQVRNDVLQERFGGTYPGENLQNP